MSGRSKRYIKSRKQGWDKTLRVTKIPEEYNKQRLRQVPADILELEAGDNVKIHSLAFDAVDEEGLRYKVATVSFDIRPALLPETSKDWGFELPNGDNNEPDDEREGQRIYIDEHFRVFTPLSAAEARETHTLEYEHHELREHYYSCFQLHCNTWLGRPCFRLVSRSQKLPHVAEGFFA